MTKIGKRLKSAREGVNREKFYSVDEAVKVIKSRAKAKFDETVEIAMNLGVLDYLTSPIDYTAIQRLVPAS